jgi:rhodanese-related sulfurtransferase
MRAPRAPGRKGKTGNAEIETIMKRLLAVCVLSLLAVTVRGGEFADISVKDLREAIAAKKVTVFDVNGSESFKKGHIPGALDFDATKAKLASVLPKEKGALIVAYCGGPSCMAYQAAAKAAKELGYTNVKHLSAGISGWKEAGEKVEKSS